MSIQFVIDTFDRADSANLGANWTIQTGNDPIKIVSNNGLATALNVNADEVYYAPVTRDQFVGVTLATISGAGQIQIAGCLRAVTDADTQYQFRAQRNGGGGETSLIMKVVAGVITNLATEAATTWLANDVIFGVAVGQGLQLYRNATLLLTVTDTALVEGRAGAKLSADAPAVLTDAQIGSWSAGDLNNSDYSLFPKPEIADAVAQGQMF